MLRQVRVANYFVVTFKIIPKTMFMWNQTVQLRICGLLPKSLELGFKYLTFFCPSILSYYVMIAFNLNETMYRKIHLTLDPNSYLYTNFSLSLLIDYFDGIFMKLAFDMGIWLRESWVVNMFNFDLKGYIYVTFSCFSLWFIVGSAGIEVASGNSLSVCYANKARDVTKKWKSRSPVTYRWYERARWQNYMDNGGKDWKILM